MTLREIIENLDNLNKFMKTTGKIADSNNNVAGREHSGQKVWDKLLAEYEEYLRDIKNVIITVNKREGHHKNALVRNLKNLIPNEITDTKVNALRGMGYKEFEIEILKKYMILKKFFNNESEKIKDGRAVVNDRIRKLLEEFREVETYYLSVSTEASDGKNNRKLFQKHGLRKI